MSDICILGILQRPPLLCPPGRPCIPLSWWKYNGQFCLEKENETPLEWRPQSLLCTNTQIWYDTTQSDNLKSNVMKTVSIVISRQGFQRCQNIADWLIPLKKYTFEGNVVECMALHEMLHTYHALCDSLKNQSESLCLRVLAFTPFQLQSNQIVLHSITSPTFSSTWEAFAMHALL